MTTRTCDGCGEDFFETQLLMTADGDFVCLNCIDDSSDHSFDEDFDLDNMGDDTDDGRYDE